MKYIINADVKSFILKKCVYKIILVFFAHFLVIL